MGFDNPPIPWAEFEADYGRIRDSISRVVPGFEEFNERIADPAGLVLANPVNAGIYRTPSGKAVFTGNHLDWLETPPGHLVLQSLRSHDQWNTIPYALDDRYRGIHGARRVVMVNPADLAPDGSFVQDHVDAWRVVASEELLAGEPDFDTALDLLRRVIGSGATNDRVCVRLGLQ